ncbi:MAG: calcium/sodium antiporter [Prevotella sp.]|nr:calcium/sodium antiporter [Prevotella sp.]
MILNIIYIIIGVALVIWGADRMTDGAASLARRMHISEMVIGLTIVAAGTSAPELFVSLMSALKGTPDMAVGNVIGSNIFNTMLIVGCAAMVAPMTISVATVRKDIPFAVAATMLLIVLCLDSFSSFSIDGNTISRLDGIILLAGLAVFMGYTLRTAKAGYSTSADSTASADSAVSTVSATSADSAADAAPISVVRCLAYVALGLACLVGGSNLFVDAAADMARGLGVSDGVIGLTIVAGGTSMPELATSVVAARKGKSAIAIGNVIGSNVFNVLAILGITATICPMQLSGITLTDLLVMGGSIMAVWLFSFTRYTVERWEGAVLTAAFMAYLGYLLSNVMM